MTAELDCLTCGACCVTDHGDADYVHVGQDDIDRLSADDVRRLVVESRERGGGGQWLTFRAIRTAIDRSGLCRCMALRGTVGLRVACTIYERRPGACRRFEPGNTVCLAAREANIT